MKKTISVLLLLMALPFMHQAVLADGYEALWKKVEDGRQKDLPRSQIAALEAIIQKAGNEKAYGHLLKAELDKAALTVSLAPDSLHSVTDALEAKAASAEKDNYALYAIYNTVLGRIYKDNDIAGKNGGKAYFEKALSQPGLLAAYKATDYVPLVVRGAGSRYFNDDLLSMLGYEAGEYKVLHDYYEKAGNRVASMLTALEMLREGRYGNKNYTASLDSLISIYSDLTECGEVAIERYMSMTGTKVSAQEKVEYIDMALGKWGAWQCMNTLRNERTMLTNPSFDVSMDQNVVRPGSAGKVSVSITNIGSLTMTVSRLSLGGDTKLEPDNANDLKKIKASVTVASVARQTLTFRDKADYETVTDSMFVNGLPAGVYLLEFTADNKGLSPRRRLLYVTDMYVVGQRLPGKMVRFAVLSSTTGQPVPGAMLYVEQDRGAKQTLTCDGKGEVLFNNSMDRGLTIRPFTTVDKACPPTSSWGHFSYYAERNDNDIVSLYTDRGIYRPGQTVHVSAIAFNNSHGVELKALAGRKMTITMRDANRKVVGEKTVVTDEYGGASADFVLPSAGLTGRFSLSSDFGQYGSTSVRVEYYKRPSFRVEFDDVSQSYSRGDTITLKGRAVTYSGVPVQGAKVAYTVSRRLSMWGWGRYDATGDGTLDKGEAVTGSDGAFEVRMPMVLPDTYTDDGNDVLPYRISRFYRFTAQADVTDAGGETHGCEKMLTLGNKPVSIQCDMPEMMERDSIKAVTFDVRNASGVKIPGTVKYYIDDDSYTFTAKANEPVMLDWGSGREPVSGRHRLVAVCGGDTLRHEFTVFSIDDIRPAFTTHSWFYATAGQFPRDGKPVCVQVGSSDKDVHVLYTIISGDKLLESGTFGISDSVATRKFEYRDEYGRGILLNYIWVKDGQAYSHCTYIERPMPDKRLSLKWTTFRNKLKPGQSETWTLSITRPDGTPADARLLAAMYDASLEQVAPFNWYFNTYMRQNRPYTQWNGLNFNGMNAWRSLSYKPLTVKPLEFNHMDIGGFFSYKFNRRYGYEGVLMAKSAISGIKVRGASSLPVVKEDSETYDMAANDVAPMRYAAKKEAVVTGATESAVEEEKAVEDGGNASGGGSLRENFSETAFFYPSLATDASGNVAIRFTLPESVTTWRFMGLAHDKDMNNGMIYGETVASKDVMVQPNVPRFVRSGDKAVLSVRVFNTSDKAVSGTLLIDLINPETDKVEHTGSRKFSVEAGETGSVSFDVDFSGFDSPVYIYKVTADGKTFSDGEQHYLPVLPDAEMVTNTMPFTQNGPETTTVDLGKMTSPASGKKGMQGGRLIIEYTENPAWLMLQALPYVGSADEQNAVSLAAAYYANGLGAYIVGQSPKIKTTFAQWQAGQDGAAPLASALQNNEELKSIALDETPWVAEAVNEAEQKQALAKFFDENTLQYNRTKMLEAMSRLQNADGSFSWWKGMGGSAYMTAEVAEYLTRLNILTSVHSETASMLKRACGYLGKEMISEVNEMKRREKAGEPVYMSSGLALRYLYINAISGRTLPVAEKSAADYLMKYIEKQKLSQNLYDKALTAVVLYKNGNRAKAAEYVKSLKEHTVFTEEMGRYYDTPRAGYSWCDYRIPVQTAAIEAMQAITPDDGVTINEMKRWLLQSKRTQAWDTPVNSVNAIYAFMHGADNVLGNGVQAVIKVDGKTADMPKATAGTGYVKTAMSAGKARQVSIAKTSEGTSWGCVYVQYMQPVTEIEDASEGLSVKREIFVNEELRIKNEELRMKNEEWEIKSEELRIKNEESFKVGDRIKVRITIKAGRDYDFVHVADRRAACMEPVGQLSGYARGYYTAPKDNSTCYYFDIMRKGTHVIETEYYIDRAGTYETGTCTVQCAYSPEYMARTKSQTIKVMP